MVEEGRATRNEEPIRGQVHTALVDTFLSCLDAF